MYLLLVAAIFISSCGDEKSKSNTEDKGVIQPLAEHNYSVELVPENMTVKEKKMRFISLLLPAIETVYSDLENLHRETSKLIDSEPESEQLALLKEIYKAENNQALLDAIKPHPKSIALAQAAMESAWGTSRFFTQANNVFGVWSFDKNGSRLAAGEQRNGKTIWVKKYSSINESISDYYKVLARGAVYQQFREKKVTNQSPYELVKQLDRYSEKGDEYGKELASMIRFNKFEQYDKVTAE